MFSFAVTWLKSSLVFLILYITELQEHLDPGSLPVCCENVGIDHKRLGGYSTTLGKWRVFKHSSEPPLPAEAD